VDFVHSSVSGAPTGDTFPQDYLFLLIGYQPPKKLPKCAILTGKPLKLDFYFYIQTHLNRFKQKTLTQVKKSRARATFIIKSCFVFLLPSGLNFVLKSNLARNLVRKLASKVQSAPPRHRPRRNPSPQPPRDYRKPDLN
jgi:hypothetical protein